MTAMPGGESVESAQSCRLLANIQMEPARSCVCTVLAAMRAAHLAR